MDALYIPVTVGGGVNVSCGVVSCPVHVVPFGAGLPVVGAGTQEPRGRVKVLLINVALMVRLYDEVPGAL